LSHPSSLESPSLFRQSDDKGRDAGTPCPAGAAIFLTRNVVTVADPEGLDEVLAPYSRPVAV
jgi:hypothetical protein